MRRDVKECFDFDWPEPPVYELPTWDLPGRSPKRGAATSNRRPKPRKDN